MSANAEAEATGSAYDFTFTGLVDGKPLKLSDYKGKVLLVVNTASKCGFTGQYEGLEKLYQDYKEKGLVVIGVPSNTFSQEKGSAAEIANFCKKNYGVSFPMTDKENVKGDNQHPFFAWVAQILGKKALPQWNFTKYLIDGEGKIIARYGSMTKPQDKKLVAAIEAALAGKP